MRDGLLQRSLELAALERQVQQIRAGSGRVILVQGPAGVGKSSLVRAVAQSAGETGVQVLSACAGPLEREAGWGVVRQLFGPIGAGPEWDQLGVGAAALARRVLDPDPFAPAPVGDAGHAASYGLSWLAYGLAEDAPTLLVVDDVHWTDTPSLRWLAQLSGHLTDLRLGVLCAVRSGEPVTEAATLADLVAAAPEPPLQPRPLGVDAVETLVTHRLPGADPAFVAACHAASGGNPFLLGALVDQVIAGGLEPSSEIAAKLTMFGPEQVGRSVEVQLARLPAGTSDLARAFAVLGRGALLRQAAEVAGLDLVRAHHLADGLVASGLAGRADDGFALTHPLVANALYLGLLDGERSLLHRRAARVLASERADVETVGLHLLHAEPAGEPQTVSTLRAAAERANRRGAPDSAGDLPPPCAARATGQPCPRGRPAQRARALPLRAGAARRRRPARRRGRAGRHARAARADRPVREPCSRDGRPLRPGHRALPAGAGPTRRRGRRPAWAARAGDGVRHVPRRRHRRGGARPGPQPRGFRRRAVAGDRRLGAAQRGLPRRPGEPPAAARPRRGHPAAQRRVAGEHDREVPAHRQRRAGHGPEDVRRTGRAGPPPGMADRPGARQLHAGHRAHPPRPGPRGPCRRSAVVRLQAGQQPSGRARLVAVPLGRSADGDGRARRGRGGARRRSPPGRPPTGVHLQHLAAGTARTPQAGPAPLRRGPRRPAARGRLVAPAPGSSPRGCELARR